MPAALLLCVLSVCVVAAGILIWATLGGVGRVRMEGFDGDASEPLTGVGQIYGDPTLCTLWPSGYSFASEGLVAHPTSSPSDPKCVLLRDGMGLLQGDIAGSGSAGANACAPTVDAPELHWLNPLNQAGNGGAIAKLYAENVAGIDRCVVSFAVDASSTDLMEVDAAMSLAGAQIRSQMPVVLQQLEVTTSSLATTTQALANATAQLGADSGQMASDSAALASCQSDVRQGEVQLEALAASSESAMASAVQTFKQQYGTLQTTSEQRLSSRIARDKAELENAVANQKTVDAAACAAQVAPLQAKVASLEAQLPCPAQVKCPDPVKCADQAKCPEQAACPACPAPAAAAAPGYYHHTFSFHWTNGTGGWSSVIAEGVSAASADDANQKLLAIVNPVAPPWSGGNWNHFGWFDQPSSSTSSTQDYNYKIQGGDPSGRADGSVWIVRTGGPSEIKISPDHW